MLAMISTAIAKRIKGTAARKHAPLNLAAARERGRRDRAAGAFIDECPYDGAGEAQARLRMAWRRGFNQF